jgi:hypothetical protein
MLGKSTFIVLAICGSLILPAGLSAQTGAVGSPPAGSAGAGPAAVSGVPTGPGSAGGANNSVYDPSGIGNAPKPLQAPSPAPSSAGLASPAGSPPISSSTQPGPRFSAPSGRLKASREARRAERTSRRAATNAVISAQDHLLDRKLKSICRGC